MENFYLCISHTSPFLSRIALKKYNFHESIFRTLDSNFWRIVYTEREFIRRSVILIIFHRSWFAEERRKARW